MIQTATVVLPAGRLTASAVDVEARTIEGILVPWNELGQPSINGAGRRVRVRENALTLAASVTGIDTHDRPRRDVSTLVAHELRPEGIWGRLSVDTTSAGDTLLAAVADGKRLGLSVEANDLLLDGSTNEVIGGVVDLVAHVDDPAFPSARIHTMAAALAPTPNDPTGDTSVTDAPPAAVAAPAAPAPLDYAQLAAALAPHLTAAAAPAGLPTGALVVAPPAAPAATPAADPAPGRGLLELATMQAAQAAGDTTMMAALADITNSDLPIFQRPAGAIPQELWRNSAYTRRYVPLLTPKPLTSITFGGWEFVELPEVDDWAGDKTEIPTNEVSTREVTDTAKRLAGGWDIDRKFRDFADQKFWASFYQAQTTSYARKSDLKALAAILAAAQDVTETGVVEGYTRPPGYGTVASQADVLKAVAFGTAYLEDTPLIYDHPDFVLMNTTDWLTLLDITNLDLPAFLSLLGVEPGAFQRSPFVPRGSVVMGVNEAVEWHELPGEAPIRVEALDVARGGIDSAVFGYWGTLHVRPGGIISVPLTSAG